MKDKAIREASKCQFMKAAKVGIEKTTFHAIPWVLENIKTIFKVGVTLYFVLSYIVVAYFIFDFVRILFHHIN